MLTELRVSNFAIIDELHIQFGEGLNILTGETGAGKSVILKSLGLLMGLKASADHIRSGSAQARVEGCFDLSSRKDILKKLELQEIPAEDNSLVIRRILSGEKSRVYLNGTLSTLANLRDLVAPLLEVGVDSAPLIEMTGQFENRDLLNASYHLDLLDGFAGNWEIRERYTEKYQALKQIEKQIQNIEQSEATRIQKLDFLSFQRDEIVALDMAPGEDLQLEQEMLWLKNLKKNALILGDFEQRLDSPEEGVSQKIGTLLLMENQGRSISDELGNKVKELAVAAEKIEELLFAVQKEQRALASRAESADDQLDRLESKWSQYRKLQKKYGGSLEGILQHLVKIETEIAELSDSSQRLEDLRMSVGTLTAELESLAKTLHKNRSQSALVLVKKVNDELLDLDMKGVLFFINLKQTLDLTPSGKSHLEFQVQSSKRMEPKPLAKFASGGEMSRILLAIKRVIGSSKFPRTYLFDEVDTGVSGPTAEKVGRKLASIAQGQQVLCVTHLPQVAAFADRHFCIGKTLKKGVPVMELKELDSSGREHELARLISGERVSQQGLRHAHDLIAEAQNLKTS